MKFLILFFLLPLIKTGLFANFNIYTTDFNIESFNDGIKTYDDTATTDNDQDKRKMYLKLNINCFPYRNEELNIGKIGLYSRKLIYPGFDFVIESKNKNYHSLGFNFLCKPSYFYINKDKDYIDKNDETNIGFQINYKYEYLFKKFDFFLKPKAGIEILPSYQNAKLHYRYADGSLHTENKSYMLSTFFIPSKLDFSLNYYLENLIISIGARLNFVCISYEKVKIDLYEYSFEGGTYIETVDLEDFYWFWIKDFLDDNLIIDNVYIGVYIKI